MSKLYQDTDVYTAAQARLQWIFGEFRQVAISVSGGKDSGALFEMAWEIAQEQGRKIHCFFLDEEVVYQATVRRVRDYMTRPGVVPHWWQTPYKTTNATGYDRPLLHVWGEDEPLWMREKESGAMGDRLPLPIHRKQKDAFHHVLRYAERHLWDADTALLMGLRADESLNRYRATTTKPALDGVLWSAKTAGPAISFSPLYDWAVSDIWTYFGRTRKPYNRIYDLMWAKGLSLAEMRISSLIHEKAFRCLRYLHEFEPRTYDRLLQRVPSAAIAARYADDTPYTAHQRPSTFKTWRDYRDFLLNTLPPRTVAALRDRFAGHGEGERVARQQVQQILVGDRENLLPIEKAVIPKTGPKTKWKDL